MSKTALKSAAPAKQPTILPAAVVAIGSEQRALVAADQAVSQLARQLNYQGSTDPDVLENSARDAIRRIGAGIFELGGYLLLLKEACPHGQFLPALERLGIGVEASRRYMQIAKRFANSSTSRHLEALGMSKLVELLAILTERGTTWAQKSAALKSVAADLSESFAAAGARINATSDAFAKAAGTADSAADATSRLKGAADASTAAAAQLSQSWVSIGQAMGKAANVANSVRDASNAAQDYADRMQKLYGRPGEGANKWEEGRLSTRGEKLAPGTEEIGTGGYQFRNAQGMSSDAKGNAIQMFKWTRASIIDYLTQSGLAAELAEDLAKQFVQADGSVPYIASEAQKRWGGQYSTLAGALGKMADYYKYDSSGKFEAAQRQAFLTGSQGGTASTAAASSGATYVSNITIDGQRSTLTFADADSQRQAEALLRRLAQDKARAA